LNSIYDNTITNRPEGDPIIPDPVPKPVPITTQVPSTPAKPTTFYNIPNDSLIIEWTAPFDGNLTITNYVIAIQQADGTYANETTYCVGPTVTFGTACEIPASVLRALPWGLSQGADVNAKVVAVNALGDSDFS
jgi:hypothetical protein